MSRSRLVLILAVIAAVIAFFAFDLGRFFSLDFLKSQQAAIDSFYQANPVGTALGFLAVYIAVTALSLPGAAVLTLAAGAVFGLLVGTVLASIASTVGATLAFLIARFALRDFVQDKYGQRLKAINRGVEKDGAFYLFGLRLALEGFAAAAVAMANPRPDLSSLHRLNAEMENCIAAGDIDAYNNVANAFHGAIVTAAGNGLLRDAYDRVKARFRRYQTVMANIPHLPPRSVSEHEQILVAMENGDASAARDLAEGHIRDLVAAYRDTAQDCNLFTKAS